MKEKKHLEEFEAKYGKLSEIEVPAPSYASLWAVWDSQPHCVDCDAPMVEVSPDQWACPLELDEENSRELHLRLVSSRRG